MHTCASYAEKGLCLSLFYICKVKFGNFLISYLFFVVMDLLLYLTILVLVSSGAMVAFYVYRIGIDSQEKGSRLGHRPKRL